MQHAPEGLETIGDERVMALDSAGPAEMGDLGGDEGWTRLGASTTIEERPVASYTLRKEQDLWRWSAERRKLNGRMS